MQDKDRLGREGGLDRTTSINTAEDWAYWDRGDTMKLASVHAYIENRIQHVMMTSGRYREEKRRLKTAVRVTVGRKLEYPLRMHVKEILKHLFEF